MCALFSTFFQKVEKWTIRRRAKPDQILDTPAGVNLSDGKNVVPEPQQGRVTFGRREKVFAFQNQLASKNDAGLKLDFTLLAKRAS